MKNVILCIFVFLISIGIISQVQAARPVKDEVPIASFTVTPNPVELFAVATFDGTASADDNGIVEYCWDFGDGSIQDCSGAIVDYSYAAEGSYIATLIVTDTIGQTANSETTITVEIDRIAALEDAIASLIAENADLKARISTVEGNSVLALGDKLTYVIDNHGYPTALFTGVNLQVVNGVQERSKNGVGNIIVGYNEDRVIKTEFCSDTFFQTQAECETYGLLWAQVHKTGSHNLVVGFGHNYAQYGSVAFGSQNVVNASYATVTGGAGNVAAQQKSSVSGGVFNTATGAWSSISGGAHNLASGDISSISGGRNNVASALYSVVSGGLNRTANGESDWVAGSLFEDY